MKHLDIDLKSCYGIGSFKVCLKLDKRHVAIYASNGVMKTSLAQTFDDLGTRESRDRVTDKHEYRRIICDDNGNALENDTDSVLVLRPYRSDRDTVAASSEILASEDLRVRYENIIKSTEADKRMLLEHLKSASGLKTGIEDAILRDFGYEDAGPGAFFDLLGKLAKLDPGKSDELESIKYVTIDKPQVRKLLSNKDFREHHAAYVSAYNRLLADSPYLTADFDHTSAATACKQLGTANFFEAKHQVRLIPSTGDKPRDLKKQKEFKKAIDDEIGRIDKKSRPLWDKIDDLFSPNREVRELRTLAHSNRRLRLELGDPDELRRNLWKAYLSAKSREVDDLVSKHSSNKSRIAEILESAERERTDWDEVISKYNKRFAVPFELSLTNRADTLLGGVRPDLDYYFKHHDGSKYEVKRDQLTAMLSEGENRAFYLLNALFEIEGRIKRLKKDKNGKKVVIIADDIADSFDYKNKHAIVQYLKEISEHEFFHLVILTHNFDFFRTVCSRQIAQYDRCYYVGKNGGDLSLFNAQDILNPLKDFVDNMHETKKFISCIPFARTILGHTSGTSDEDYATLSSILHYRAGTDKVKAKSVLKILDGVFPKQAGCRRPLEFGAGRNMTDLVRDEAKSASKIARADPDKLILSDKLVLAVYIRVAAERFILQALGEQISDNDHTTTYRLVERYKETGRTDIRILDVLDRVVLIAPEVIHINSFMYEPILDMSSDSLVRLYNDVRTLDGEAGNP